MLVVIGYDKYRRKIYKNLGHGAGRVTNHADVLGGPIEPMFSTTRGIDGRSAGGGNGWKKTYNMKETDHAPTRLG